jgi:hypothetical protein
MVIKLRHCNVRNNFPLCSLNMYYSHRRFTQKFRIFTVRIIYLMVSIHQTCTVCGCKVPGIILLRDLNGARRLDHSKDIFVHVSTCNNYDFNALTAVVWRLWR